MKVLWACLICWLSFLPGLSAQTCALTINPITGLFDCKTGTGGGSAGGGNFIGTGAPGASSVSVTHNANTHAVVAQCHEDSGGAEVFGTIDTSNLNSTTVNFATTLANATTCVFVTGAGTGSAVADQTLLGNISGGSATPVGLTAAQGLTLLNAVAGKSSLTTANLIPYVSAAGTLSQSTTKLNGGIFYPTSDSTTAIQFDKADGTTPLLTFDTTHGLILVGATTANVFAQQSGSPGATQIDQTFRNSGTNNNVATFQNMSNTGFSAIRVADETGTERSAFGYGNSGTGAPFGSATYVESSYPGALLSGVPPLKLITTAIAGSRYTRLTLDNDGGNKMYATDDAKEYFRFSANGRIIGGTDLAQTSAPANPVYAAQAPWDLIGPVLASNTVVSNSSRNTVAAAGMPFNIIATATSVGIQRWVRDTKRKADWEINGSGPYTLDVRDTDSSGTPVILSMPLDGTRLLGIASSGALAMSSTTDANGAKDTSLSRISAGIVGVGTGAAGSVAGTLQAKSVAIISPTVPGAASDACTAGAFSWDTGFIYLCTASGAWKRAAIITF